MEQTKALNALEPFLSLLPSATSPRAQADLITRATSTPHTYLFAPLLSSAQIQSLASHPELGGYHTLLTIFSTGTYATYLSSRPTLPALSEAQAFKLRQLSLLTLSRSRQLSYQSLLSSLGLESAAELEELVRKSVYDGLVKATLDPKAGLVHVHSVSALRDVAPSSVPDLLESLQTWASRCDEALMGLRGKVESVRRAADLRAREKEEWDDRLGKMVEDEGKVAAAGGGGGLPGFDGAVSTGGGLGGLGHGGHVLGGLGHGLGGTAGTRELPDRFGGGGGSGGASAGAGGKGRYGKRGSGHMEGAEEEGGGDREDEAMDVDEDDVGGQKKASRRKL